jgi:hypothetical protein
MCVHAQPELKSEDKPENVHAKALQYLSNGYNVPYSDTLRLVTVEGSREPLLAARQSQKQPGYIRNESGGVFTS